MRLSDLIKDRAAGSSRADDEGRRWAEAYSAYLSKSAMKRRGWSGGMVRLLLGEPDKTVPNPHDPHGGEPASLYLRSRVLEAEATPEFKADLAQRDKRR